MISGYTGTCPHCLKGVRFEDARRISGGLEDSFSPLHLVRSGEGRFQIFVGSCPLCFKLIVLAQKDEESWLVWPRFQSGRNINEVVPDELKNEFIEAEQVSQFSPKAGAALARRTLELLLIRQGANGRDLRSRIEVASPGWPPSIAQLVDCVRDLGNISAHAKENSLGEILDVEPDECDLVLGLLFELFDHYYVKPAIVKERHSKLLDRIAERKNPS